MLRSTRAQRLRAAAYAAAFVLLAGAGAYLLLAADKGLGIFFVLIAAVLSRILVIDVVDRLDA